VIRYRKLDGQNVNFAAPAAWIAEIAERAAAQSELREWRRQAVGFEGEARWAELATHAARRSERVADEPEAWFWLACRQRSAERLAGGRARVQAGGSGALPVT
jgi:hypothetical protein